MDLYDILSELLETDNPLTWEFEDSDVSNNSCEVWCGSWWRQAQRTAEEITDRKLLCIILYTDGINVDWAGKINLCPIMMTLGNFHLHHQRSTEGKRLLGFIPQFAAYELEQMFDGNASAPMLGIARRKILHDCMDM